MKKGTVVKITAKYSTIEILLPEGKSTDGLFELFRNAEVVDTEYVASKGGYQHFLDDKHEVSITVSNTKIFSLEEIEQMKVDQKAHEEAEKNKKMAEELGLDTEPVPATKPQEKSFLDD